MNQNQQNQARSYSEVAAGGSDNPRWEPNKNDNNPSYPKELEGYFKNFKELPGRNGSFYVAEIQMMNPDGSLGQCVDISGGKVLEDKLKTIALNSWIMIQYLGKVASKGGNTYNDWKTFVDDGAVPLHQLMGLPAPVQHFQQASVAQQQAPNPFGQQQAAPVFNQAPVQQQNPFGNAPVAQQQAPVFGQNAQQAAPVFNTPAPTAQPVFNTPPATNQQVPAFQQQVPAFNQPVQAPPAFHQQSAPVQNNGQMPGMQGQPNPFAQNVGSDGLPF